MSTIASFVNRYPTLEDYTLEVEEGQGWLWISIGWTEFYLPVTHVVNDLYIVWL